MAAITFDEFSYAYPGGVKALDAVSAEISAGSFTVVAGLSGAGKTTLCMAVCGVVPHYYGGGVAGAVRVAGVDTAAVSMAELAATVGTVMEDYESQLITMTAAEEIAFALENAGVPHAEITRAIAEALEQVGLAGMGDREVAGLSGGQKQRLAIAAAIAARPGILVLDEPASALDPEGAEEIYGLIGRLNRERGMTVVVAEHDLARVAGRADQLIVLAGGRVAHRGTPAAVFPRLWREAALREMVPPLWQVKLGIEEALAAPLGPWADAGEAAEELRRLLTPARREECSSA